MDMHRDSSIHDESEGGLFTEINKLRKLDSVRSEDEEIRERAKFNSSIFATIATHKIFEGATMLVIIINAAFIGIDADHTARGMKGDDVYDIGPYSEGKTPLIFPIMENLFAFYFTLEVAIRFLAFKRKLNCFCDMWFVFDSLLVAFMIVETWILPIFKASGPLSQLSVLRLLRLLRMVKFMRFVPELQIIAKGLVASVRAVASTALLQVLLLYVFGIFFTTFYHQGPADDKDDIPPSAQLFGSMGKSMRTLFIMGTILDDVTEGTNTIRSSKHSTIMLIVFIIFILVSSFTILNMLIGILCEVVSATSEGEQAKTLDYTIRSAMSELFTKMDRNKDGEITKKEFLNMRRNKEIMDALTKLNIEGKHFRMYADVLFHSEGAEKRAEPLDYHKLVMTVLRLRPGTTMSRLDFADFKNQVEQNNHNLQSQIAQTEQKVNSLHECMRDCHFTPNRAPVPTPAAKPPDKMSVATLIELERTSDADILQELQRRLGVQTQDQASASKIPAAGLDTLGVEDA